MLRYGDDQCAQCGGIRVAGSPLCEKCLIALVNTYAPAHDIEEARIKELEEKNQKLTNLVEKLLDHIMIEGLYTADLRRQLWEYVPGRI